MLTPFDKAIVSGLSAAILSEAARFGWQPNGQAVSILSLVLTALVPYVIAHATVYFTTNKRN